jgi:hypothetical protein
MYLKSAITAALLVFAVPAFAQGTAGAPGQTPGQQTQKAAKSTAPGAAETQPGKKMKKAAKKSKAPGASEGQTTGSAPKQRY